jgi:RNA polymerase sigma-70 factor (ECF subfamily)
LLEAGRAAWPDVAVASEAFAAYVEAHAAEPGDGVRLHAGDLYLCCACAEGNPIALAAFERRYLAPLAGQVVRSGTTADVAAEVVQDLRERLFVGRLTIHRYDGSGALAAWLRVAAVRAASNARRDATRRAQLLAADGSLQTLPVIDPALALVKRRYGEQFSGALRDAFAALDEEARNVLRLHFSDGLNLDAIAKVLGISRATAGRRMLAARERVRDETLRLLGERIAVGPEELESLLAVVRSTLDVSLGALM